MASSSRPSSSYVPPTGRTYDIFLSFRGEDTRNNFVDHLHAALVQKGIHTFKDDQMLGGGKHISQSLLKAIRESKFAVVVFSENYANSSWCLDELSEIMECHDQMGLKVLPVFYHVDPSDVRKQKGRYELNLNGGQNEVNKWREALTAAANLSGYHISPVSGGEIATIKKIVQDILRDIQPRGRENDLIGIESGMVALNLLLSIEATDEVRFVGIHGMGGIGKTTIARALFGRIAYWFDGSSFINDVRENSSTNRDICALQERILTDVLGRHDEFKINDIMIGRDKIRDRFCNKKVLLVLDDVDDVRQLEFLAAGHSWFGLGSIIIITTRDEHVLSDAKFVKYKPSLLRMDQALELFSRHAFNKSSPPDEFKQLANRAIGYADCLPLALKVLGSFFRGRKVDAWESGLDRLAQTPNKEIVGSLKISFDALEESEKKIFLDIACFFKGEKVDHVIRVLDSFDFHPVIGIDVLKEKSLITVSANRLHMHDLIQEMGWQVVRESASDTRLRNYEKIHDIIINKKLKLELIEAIVNPRVERFRFWSRKFIVYPKEQRLKILELSKVPYRHIVFSEEGCSADVFKCMRNLRLLQVKRNFTSLEPTLLPNELRWLCWDAYPFSSLPLADMCKLVGLEMSSHNIKHLWKGQKIMPNLKFIQLKYLDRLSKFPDVSGAPNIERLTLYSCNSLVGIHESLGLLKRLVHLEMRYCEKLKHLPSRFELKSLETLILQRCNSLKILPKFAPCMVKLSHIDVSSCYRLKELPSSIRNVCNLRTLNIVNCVNLHLGQAESFIFHDLTNYLCSLRKLDLKYIEIRDQDFPKYLYGLPSLEELYLSVNSELPASISQLSHLKHLGLAWCDRLQSLKGLPSEIQVLEARDCFSLEVIEDLSEKYEWLYKIDLSGCYKLLKDKQNEIYLDKMLKQSFLKKWAAIDGCLSITISGCKIPSWFKEQHDGNRITMKLPFKWQTQIKGFAICGMFSRSLLVFPSICFRFENCGTLVPMLEVDCINATPTTTVDDENYGIMWIGYVPLSLLENMRYNDDDDDWSNIIEGNLVIEVTNSGVGYNKAIRCGVEFVYKEEVESTQQIIKPPISSYYWKWNLTHDISSRNTTVYDFGDHGSLLEARIQASSLRN